MSYYDRDGEEKKHLFRSALNQAENLVSILDGFRKLAPEVQGIFSELMDETPHSLMELGEKGLQERVNNLRSECQKAAVDAFIIDELELARNLCSAEDHLNKLHQAFYNYNEMVFQLKQIGTLPKE